jgi:putative ABC transport system permease protein
MIRNYIKVAIRHLLRNKGITVINVAGLAIGMACCILIVLFIRDELSYNRFHANSENIYRLNSVAQHKDGQADRMGISQFGAGPALREESSRVKDAVRFYTAYNVIISKGADKFKQDQISYADAGFLNMFSFPMISGNPSTALKEPYTGVLTESAAKKYFGDEDPVGRSIRFQDAFDCQITGVVKDVPSNSDIKFDVLLSMETWRQNVIKAGGKPEGSWYGFSDNYTFVLLNPGVTPGMMNGELKAFVAKHIGEIAKRLGETFSYELQPLANIHMRPNGDNASLDKTPKLYLYGAIGLFIILIACINFMNLVTARAHERAMEVGLRKVMGAERKALIVQFLVESILVSLLSFLFALLLAQIMLPGFNYATDKTLSLFSLQNISLFSTLLLLSMVVGLLAGSYPALYLSGFLPVRILKGGLKSAGTKSLFRKALVVSQFTIAIALIISTVVIYLQLRYLQQKDLGYDKTGLVNFYLHNDKQANSREIFKAEVEKLPFVKNTSYTSAAVGDGPNNANPVGLEGSLEEDSKVAYIVYADFSYFTNLGIKMAEGRDFDARFPTDSLDAFVINRSAAKKFGLTNPIGSRLEWRGSNEPRKGTVIGVVEDFNFESLRLPVGPMLAMIRPGYARVLTVRLEAGDRQEQLAGIETLWNKMMPAFPFNYSFVENSLAGEYKQEQRDGSLFGAYAGLAIVIACMGLFGLAMLVARQRTKEIGIRKVLGASITSITALLSKDFIQLVFIAILIASPIAWYGMDKWLQEFAFHVPMPWWAFVAAGAGALIIALVTISFQSVKAALLNPVKSLKSE